ncbi:MAG: GNAT family N-acetyltransferase [Gaiellales bacterium]|jgi:GNAT superfamily N-acetyltransferase|nr:GNAT family N-acetyltransferase [Gaiellales bacterium]
MAAARERRLREVGCWSIAPDRALGERLGRLGFQDGWAPHWMAREAEPAAEPPAAVELIDDSESLNGAAVPYWDPDRHDAAVAWRPGRAFHLLARDHDRAVGHGVLTVDGAYGGLFDMGVAADARRRGIGLALTRAAVGLAHVAGCRLVALNATGEGEPLYRKAGFRSAGWGHMVVVSSLARGLGA